MAEGETGPERKEWTPSPEVAKARELLKALGGPPPIKLTTPLPFREIKTKPGQIVPLILSRVVQQTLSLMFGWDGKGRQRLRCDGDGWLYVYPKTELRVSKVCKSVATVGGAASAWTPFDNATRFVQFAFQIDGTIEIDKTASGTPDLTIFATQAYGPLLRVQPAWRWRATAYGGAPANSHAYIVEIAPHE